mmetsp:Transcript_14466/g.21476  ORF Transcript_14466/g.21476 Transcript_14466/m.21476 type:complete len:133 (-) Transcript_14466:147-545(-)
MAQHSGDCKQEMPSESHDSQLRGQHILKGQKASVHISLKMPPVQYLSGYGNSVSVPSSVEVILQGRAPSSHEFLNWLVQQLEVPPGSSPHPLPPHEPQLLGQQKSPDESRIPPVGQEANSRELTTNDTPILR